MTHTHTHTHKHTHTHTHTHTHAHSHTHIYPHIHTVRKESQWVLNNVKCNQTHADSEVHLYAWFIHTSPSVFWQSYARWETAKEWKRRKKNWWPEKNEVRGRVFDGGDTETEDRRRAFQLSWPNISLEDMNEMEIDVWDWNWNKSKNIQTHIYTIHFEHVYTWYMQIKNLYGKKNWLIVFLHRKIMTQSITYADITGWPE